ncbi:MAG: ComEC/Rec2 family competence protein, partial [Coriobacteriaceae bacterium]|nr:ComEC/Rec2 family competence protein [Coriobacteriaceae bacterium]
MQVGITRCLDAIVIFVFVSCVIAAVCAIWEKTPQARFILVIAVSFCAAALSASLVVETSRAAVAELGSSPVSEWSFLVTGDARFSQGRYRTRARACREGSVSTDVWLYSAERLYPGMTVRGVGRMKSPAEGVWAEASRAQGITAQVSILKIESLETRRGPLGMLDDLRRRAIASIRPSANVTRALLAACTLGDRTGIDELGSDEVLRRCGISHLVAVSGTHLALVAGACTELIDRLALHPRTRAAVLGCSTGLFVLLCGAPPSAVRAWLMVLAAIAGKTVGRRSHGTSSLSVAALAMALLDPTVTGQLAYQLSVAAVLGIRIIYPYLRYIVEVVFTARRSRHGWIASLHSSLAPFSHKMRDLIAMTVTAQVVTLPITAASFGELSVIAPISNLIAALPISFLT